MDNYKTLRDILNSEYDIVLADSLYSTFKSNNYAKGTDTFLITKIKPNSKFGFKKNEKLFLVKYDKNQIMELPEDKLPLLITIYADPSRNIEEDGRTILIPTRVQKQEDFPGYIQENPIKGISDYIRGENAEISNFYNFLIQVANIDETAFIGMNQSGLERGVLAAAVGYMSEGINLEDVKIYTPLPFDIKKINDFSL